MHYQKMQELYKTKLLYMDYSKRNADNYILEADLKTLTKKAKEKLNQDIFELQTELFKKLMKN